VHSGLEVINGVRGLARDRWVAPSGRPAAPATLFCLPYAGGAASVFQGWRAELPSLDVRPVLLPARESRIEESPEFAVGTLAAALASQVDRPYAIYGHSMGGRLAFDTVRALRASGAPLPARLLVGACRPPHRDTPRTRLAGLPDEEFCVRVAAMGGATADALEVPELRELLLPMLRADFTWAESYRYVEDEPLPVPITAIGGSQDADADVAEMAEWSRHTVAGFRLHTLPGGHFFVHTERQALLALIAADVAEAIRGGLRP
jgi:surfactin synthase thioesterase subunit